MCKIRAMIMMELTRIGFIVRTKGGTSIQIVQATSPTARNMYHGQKGLDFDGHNCPHTFEKWLASHHLPWRVVWTKDRTLTLQPI